MAKADSGARVFAKSAILWLFVGVIFASVYGALLAAQPGRDSLQFPGEVEQPVLASSEEAAPLPID